MSTNISIDYNMSERARFAEKCREMKGGGSPLITLTDLILIDDLATNKNSHTFKLKENPGSDHPLEQKLGQDELFLPLYLSIAIQRYETDAATAINNANFPHFTYPDPNYFDGAAGGNLEWQALELAFQGLLSFKVGGNEIIKDISTHHTKYVPDAQYLSAAASGQPEDQFPQYGPSIAERGYYPLYNDYVLDGNATNEIILTLGEGDNTLIAGAVDAAGAARTTRNRIMIRVLGFKCHDTLASDVRYCQLS